MKSVTIDDENFSRWEKPSRFALCASIACSYDKGEMVRFAGSRHSFLAHGNLLTTPQLLRNLPSFCPKADVARVR